jgi:hypothetical protein
MVYNKHMFTLYLMSKPEFIFLHMTLIKHYIQKSINISSYTLFNMRNYNTYSVCYLCIDCYTWGVSRVSGSQLSRKRYSITSSRVVGAPGYRNCSRTLYFNSHIKKICGVQCNIWSI